MHRIGLLFVAIFFVMSLDAGNFVPLSLIEDVDVEVYRSKFLKPEQEWVRKTFDNRFAFFKARPISQRALRLTYQRVRHHCAPHSNNLHRYRIIGNKIYAYESAKQDSIEQETFASVLRTLLQLSNRLDIPDLPNVDFLIHLGPTPPTPRATTIQAYQAPILAEAYHANIPYIMAVPNLESFKSTKKLYDLAKSSRLCWDGKQRLLYWKEKSSMVGSTNEQILGASCVRMCLLSSDWPQWIDAAFSDIQEADSSKSILGWKITPLAGVDSIQYAYLADCDSHHFSQFSHGWQELSGSVLFKDAYFDSSHYVTWLEPALQPYVNYIPFHSNLGDLVQKIAWSGKHATECKQMAKNIVNLTEENCTLEGKLFFIYSLLNEYAKHQSFDERSILLECEQSSNWNFVMGQ